MKIGYLIPDCGLSGGVAVVCQHTNRLLERGHDVVIITETAEKKINWFPNLKVPIVSINLTPSDLDILVATGWSTSFKLEALPGKRKCYFVQSDETRFHEDGSFWQHLTALSYLFSYHYITEAKWIQKWLFDNFYHQAALVPNGLDENIFYPDIPLEPKKKKPRILLEGAIDLPYKGMEDAFSVIEDIDAEIWCVSSYGKPKPSWKCDRFFSQVSMHMMRRIYSSCDILLKLSRVEGFFGPPLEMMACGGAVVVGKVTGYDEYIKDGYNALVVEQGDLDAAKTAVMKIIEDEPLRNNLIINGHETAKTWNWPNSIDKLENFFSNILVNQYERTVSEVRSLSDKGIAETTKFALMQVLDYNEDQQAMFAEPIDRLLFRIRKIKLAEIIANLLYKFYKLFK